MSRFLILVATPLSEEGLATLRAAEDAQVQVVAHTVKALQPHLAEAQALIIDDEIRVDDALLADAPKLKLIGLASASFTNVDIDAATRRGIMVMNTPGVDAVTVAEYTFSMVLALVRGVIGAHTDLLDGIWNRDLYIGNQLQGKTLGIMGYGRVGQEVASRAIAFGLDVLVADPYIPESKVAGLRVKLVGRDELLARSDILTLHTSVVPDTHHFINADTLAQMKRGAFLVNAKHSSFIDTDALRVALDDGHIAGVALDDFEPESLNQHSLIGHPKVLHTLRMRANTHEARHELSNLLAPQLLDALRDQDYRNTINLPFMPGREYERIAPHMRLGERIGILHHYLGHRSAIQQIEISISGDEMQDLLKPLTVALVHGVLEPRLGERVNYINAPVLAAERGIAVTQMRAMPVDSYQNLLACRVVWEDGHSLMIAGAIFDHTEPRIVQVDQYHTDFAPEDTLLIIGSYDVPGVIGQVGTFMADHGINIASWRTSRVDKGGQTLSIISIDDPLPDDLLAALREKDFIRHATQVVF